MKLDEVLNSDGSITELFLLPSGDHFELLLGTAVLGSISATIVQTLMRRYARPLAETVEEAAASLALSPDTRLRSWSYRAPVDLEKKRYLVLEQEGQEPIAVIARQITEALRFLLA